MGRKLKRVSDINAMGAPSTQPSSLSQNQFNPQIMTPNTGDFQPRQPIHNYQSNPYVPQSQPSSSNPGFDGNNPQFGMQQANQTHIFQQPVIHDMAFQYGQQVI